MITPGSIDAHEMPFSPPRTILVSSTTKHLEDQEARTSRSLSPASLFDDESDTVWMALLGDNKPKGGCLVATFGAEKCPKQTMLPSAKRFKKARQETVLTPRLASLGILDNEALDEDTKKDTSMQDDIDDLRATDSDYDSDLDGKPAAASIADTLLLPSKQGVTEPAAIFDSNSRTCPSSDEKIPFSFTNGLNRSRALHRACQLFTGDKKMVEMSLSLHPESIRHKAFIDCIPSRCRRNRRMVSKMFPGRKADGPTPEPFQLPINIALYHNSSLAVLEVLVQADPSQLNVKDGIFGINSLCLALDRRPHDIACMGLILANNTGSARMVSAIHKNTPLHVACQKGASLQVIRQLVQMYPQALMHRNAAGDLPSDIASHIVRSDPTESSSEANARKEVAEFLVKKTLSTLEVHHVQQFQTKEGMMRRSTESEEKSEE
ncbi:FYVE zinc finger [Seminavis robusta]|uniref:FYVE zinc finger n=1 Tax=Seminavis robusta TaxID=568900 RepID=A0A9N8HBC7_9STRA|nr:FYVE zinc finger [Seminavis robusta]|eukprot:Sro356_g125400.1 FYVE zinc finger (435) ;mRNA; r:49928-51232